MMNMKTAVVIGATKGLGRATSIAFARSGYQLVGTYKTDRSAANQLVAEMANEGISIRLIRCDAADGESNEVWDAPEIQAAEALVLVNNACPGFRPAPLHKVTWSQVEDQVNIGLKSAWISCQAAVRRMAKTGNGTIVNVSSAALEGLPPKGFAPYVIGKHALRGLTLSLASEFCSRGVRVFSVSPGFMATDFTNDWDPRLRDAIASSGARVSNPSDAGARIVELAGTPGFPGQGEDYPI